MDIEGLQKSGRKACFTLRVETGDSKAPDDTTMRVAFLGLTHSGGCAPRFRKNLKRTRHLAFVIWNVIRAQHEPERAGAFMPLKSLKTKRASAQGSPPAHPETSWHSIPLSAILAIGRTGQTNPQRESKRVAIIKLNRRMMNINNWDYPRLGKTSSATGP